MDRKVRSLVYATVLGLAPLLAPGCGPSGAQFDPATGVLTVTGTEASDSFVVSASGNGSIVVNGGAVPIGGGAPTLSNTVRIELIGLGGDDQLVIDTLGAPMPNAVLRGGSGVDVLIGGTGDDELNGGPGDDQLFLGAGDDTALWFSGDGEDTVEGQGGFDTFVFTGDDVDETFDISANGVRARVFSDVDTVTNDFGGVESIVIAARGGVDAVTVNDLTATDVTEVEVDLAASAGGPDGQTDTVTLNATQGDDGIDIGGDAGGIRVVGLPTTVHVLGQEQSQDRLVLNALAGADAVTASAPDAGGMRLTLNGGAGADTLIGSDGPDQFNGGAGNDLMRMGAGDDTSVWNPGDGSDTIEGQEGFDRLAFNGANISENLEISAVGERVRFFRNIANVTLDLDGVEAIGSRVLGGADLIVVRNLAATDVVLLEVDLAAAGGAGDGQRDSVLVDGTEGDDVLRIFGDASGTAVFGLPVHVDIQGGESANDSLTIATFGGDDALDASGLRAFAVALTADGGDGDDVLIGGEGGDVLFGGDGDDVLVGGPGLDVLDAGAGNNLVIQ
jgi:Ca2+-binding RTX toxin-like protein